MVVLARTAGTWLIFTFNSGRLALQWSLMCCVHASGTVFLWWCDWEQECSVVTLALYYISHISLILRWLRVVDGALLIPHWDTREFCVNCTISAFWVVCVRGFLCLVALCDSALFFLFCGVLSFCLCSPLDGSCIRLLWF